jgi:nucleoside-diphosphate-sugar epimerase
MRVFITGISGFIGSALAHRLSDAGHEVLGSSTRPADGSRPAARVRHSLGQEIDPTWLVGVDALVHAAWDLNPEASSTNRSGSVLWRRAAASAGAHAVFVSSYSAYPDFPTAYGRDKAAVESSFLDAGSCVVRPALVAGRGGLFGELIRRMKRGRFSFLPDGGRHDVELVDIGDVLAAIEVLIRSRARGEHDLSAGRLPLSEVCRAISGGLGRPAPIVVPVPVRPVLGALALTARFGVGSSQRERLLGYLENSRRRRDSRLAELLGRAPLAPRESAAARAAEMVHRSQEEAAFPI